MRTSLSRKNHVLIVDDNAENLLALESVLNDLDLTLVLAESAKAALKHILDHDFAVILMDAHMPIMDGFETASIIRSRQKTALTPIIFMTAFYKDEQDVTQGYALGAVDYIFKPINPLILRSKIKIFIELYNKNEQTYALENELNKRRAVEKELKLLTQQTQLILNSAGEGIYNLNSKGFITFVNPATAKILKYAIEDMIGKPWHMLMAAKQKDWLATPFYQALKKNEIYYGENTQFIDNNGKEIPVEFTAAPLQDNRPSRQGLVVLFKDISERIRSEQFARQQQHQMQLAKDSRESTMVEMATSLAHELNQPLATIANYTKGSIRRLENPAPDLKEVLAAMKKAAEQSERAGEIIHRIKSVVRKAQLYREKCAINQIIKKSVDLMEFELQHGNCQIKYELADNLPMSFLDQLQIEQVIINVIRNSIEALTEKHTPNATILIKSCMIENAAVQIDVIDNGPGYAKHIVDKLLTPYITTKPQGMGMGLSICRTIVEAHGGSIMAKIAKANGAWMQIVLPIT